MPVFNNILAGAAGQGGADAGYEIERSLRFSGDSGDSPYLGRTPSSAGNRGKWTWSGWVKRSKLGAWSVIFSAAGSGNNDYLAFEPSDRLTFDLANTGSGRKLTTRKFRDCSAFYHIVLAVDYTNATANDRIKLYVNGVLETAFDGNSAPAQNHSGNVNNNTAHRISSVPSGIDYFNGYLAEVHFIDGQALAPTDFGEYDDNNVWQPKNVSVSSINDGTTWSSTVSGHNNAASTGFDGTLSGAVSADANGTITFNTSTYSLSGNVRIYLYLQSSVSVSVNDESFVAVPNSAADGWYDTQHTGSISQIRIKGSSGAGPNFYAIEVDGELLIDSYNNSTGYGTNGFHLDFSDNSSNAALGTDSSGNSNTWTVNNLTAVVPAVDVGGDPTVSSADVPFSGGYSIAFDGNDRLRVQGPGTVSGDFTIECFIKSSSYSGIQRFFTAEEGVNSSEYTNLRCFNGNTDFTALSGVYANGQNLPTNQWNHIAITRSGSAIAYYLNGSRWATDSSSASFNITTLVLAHGYGSEYFTGSISNARFVNGQALYTGASYTVPTATLTTTSQGATASNVTTLVAHQSSVTANEGTRTGINDAGNLDSLIDTPTNYTADSGNNGGNYCTLSPLKNGQTLSNGNLDVVGTSSWKRSVGTIGMYSGKYYWEYTITASNEHIVGVGPPDMTLGGNLGAGDIPGSGYATETGNVNGTGASGTWSATGGSGAGDVIAIAFDADNGNMYVYKNGTALNSGAASHTGLVMPQVPVVSLNGSSRSGTINFGQRPFAHTPPTGYVSLCTQNLPDPTIADGSTAFDAVTYAGNGSTQSITGFNFNPDLVWIKTRNDNSYHFLTDSVRGVNKHLASNASDAEGNVTAITAFNSDGFSLANQANVNASGYNYVSWCWDAGSSNTTVATDANGSGLPGADCVYRANPSTGFSIVKVASPTATQARVHGLNKKPDLIICKSTGSSDSWHTYHSSLGYTKYINLNGNGGATSSDQFGSQEPTSTYFYVKDNTGSGANKSDGMIYYIWTAVAGYSAFGSYTGNGSADGPFVALSFAPRWIMVKVSSTNNSWVIVDSERDSYNIVGQRLRADLSNAEDTQDAVDFLSNGFKVRSATASTWNDSGQTYIYAAFAEHPFKTARAR